MSAIWNNKPVQCPDCRLYCFEETGQSVDGEVEFECQNCGLKLWSDEIEEEA